ncbi:MAG: beta-lactamase family protein [Oscillospiraceae bacterium]|jgi:CubicO group peptidase (beta-lactamase class C family)|nr:beta-lactamase family protein [Oscillospiraceae bacterium]
MKNLSAAQIALLSALNREQCRLPKRLSMTGGVFAPDAQAAVARAIERVFIRHRTVGGTVALVRGGCLAGVFPYGLARLPDVPAAVDTLYRVASVSKLTLSFGVLKLVEEGTLALDMDIGEVLGYRVRNPAYAHTPITPRQLMTHTAGLMDAPQYDGPGIAGRLALRDMLTGEGAARNFAPTSPGTVFRYSNFGAGILGSLMEKATGEPFDLVMDRALFAPLGMTAGYAPQRLLPHAGRLASGYAVRPLRKPRLVYDAPAIVAQSTPGVDAERHFMASPGRLLITAPDAARLARLLCSDGEIDGVRVLSPASMAQMRQRQASIASVPGDAGRGLNVAFAPRVFGRPNVIGHQGVAYGMNAELWADPDTGDAVVMATSGTALLPVGDLVHCGWQMVCLGFAALGGR